MKEKYKFNSRLATTEELQKAAKCIADILYKDNEKIKKRGWEKLIDHTPKKDFFRNNIKELLEQFNDIGIVHDFFEYNAQILTVCQVYNSTDGAPIITPSRFFIKNENIELLKDNEVAFNFELDEQINLLQKKIKNSGRPNVPTIENITKTIYINKALKANPNLKINVVCEMNKIGKSTYYRVNKWLLANKYLNVLPNS